MSDFSAVRSLVAATDPLTWVFTGDSVTHGAKHTYGARDYTELVAERLRSEFGRNRDAVIKTAISGRRVPDLVADFRWSVGRHRPEVVSLMFGLNDCTAGPAELTAFRDSYHQVIDSIHATTSAEILINTPNAVLRTDDERFAYLPDYVAAIREVAVQTGIPLVDHHAFWVGQESRHSWMADGCHPNAFGHRVLARTLLEALGVFDARSAGGRLFIP